jgi:hypothetical protein
MAIERRIVGFDLDDEHHWVARLECGHNQQVQAHASVDESAVGPDA